MDNTTEQELVLAGPGHRIGAVFVDAGFYILSSILFGLPYFIWSMIAWTKGQTPGKQLLKIRVYNSETLQPANWGKMFFRTLFLPGLFGLCIGVPELVLISTGDSYYGYNPGGLAGFCFFVLIALSITMGIIDLVWFFGADRKRLYDYWAKTIVINEAA